MDMEKKAIIGRAWQGLKGAWKATQPARSFIWGDVPKWMYPVSAGLVAAPFLGHHLRKKRKFKEEYIKRLHMQRRLSEMYGVRPDFAMDSPFMREAEQAIGTKLKKTAQGPMPPGGMPGGTPGAGGPPMPPPPLAGFKQQHPPPPEPLPAPPARVEQNLDRMRQHLRNAKARAGQRRKQRPGLENKVDRDEKSLTGIMKTRRNRVGYS